MQPREHVQAAFQFEETDLVPYRIELEAELEKELDAHFESTNWRESIVDFVVGHHIGHKTHTLPDGRIRDAFGTIVRQGNIMHIEEPALPEPSLVGYRWPDPERLVDWDELARVYSAWPNSFKLCGLAMGLFERSWMMRGTESILVDMLLETEFVEELLDGILDIHLKTMDLIVERVPIDAYFGGDDWCDQRTVMMGIDLWRQLFKPRLARMIDHCHELGLPYVLHSCGNVAPLADDLLDVGLDGLESLQAEAVNVYKLKKKTAGRLVLIGAMGVQKTIPFGTPNEVREETLRLINELGQGGGYVLAPSKPIPAGTPVANAVAFIETACQNSGIR